MSERHEPSEAERGRGSAHPVVPTKLRVPLAETPMVERDRLSALIEERTSTASSAPPVTAVTGPAGAGKTTALAQWARWRTVDRPSTRIAWVTLDANDNTPAYLWAAVRESLQIAIGSQEDAPDLPSAVLAAEPDFAALVITALDRVTSPVHLVLDDVHLLHDGAALRGLEMLVRHTPKSLRLVLAGRYLPPLRLSRLRLEGRLRVVDDRDLAFTREEAESLFANHGLRAAPEEADLLLRRTGGWTAGLRLAALSIARASPEQITPAEFTGALPRVADYLAEEVLQQHGEDVLRFLVATSVCDAVCTDLAVAVAEQPDAGRMLHELHRTNALVSAVDAAEDWFRYHPLLRDHLSAELDRTRPRDRPRLHQAAATWHRDNGHALAAVEHGARAEHPDLLADLVGAHGLREILSGHATRLHELLNGPGHDVPARPSMALVGALAALEAGDPPAADRLLGHLDGVVESDRLRALRATANLHRARFDGNLTAALLAASATQAGRTGDVALDVPAWLQRGIAELWRGNFDRAEEDLGRALVVGEHEGFDHAVLESLAHLAAAARARGDSSTMIHYAAQALELATERGWEHRSTCGLVHAVLAADAHRRLDDASARRMAELAVAALPERADYNAELIVASVDAITAFDAAPEPHTVVSALWKQWRQVAKRDVAPQVAAEVVPTAQRMALRVGEQQWAADMVTRVEELLGPSGEHALVQAVLSAHRGRSAAARKLVEPVLRGTLSTTVPGTLVDAWVLEATVLNREGSTQQAHDALRKALAAAEPLQALRPFVNAGHQVRDLLARGVGRFGRLDRFATAVLTTVPTASSAEPEGLTTRERALLVELPSMRTAEEIADSMYVSINTVKTHLRGIYRKLGVSQRRDAVVVARQRGLI